MEYMTPKKKETIDLAESLDFASLKLIEKDNQNSKSKKRPKVVFLRRWFAMIYCLNFIDFVDFLYIDIKMNATP